MIGTRSTPSAQSEITRLTELRLTALEDRIEAELALGGHTALCSELAQLARDHPLRELSEIATRYARPALAAAAECAQATVLFAEGDPAMAAASLRRGIALWREAGAPCETARARLLPGEALERHGDRRHALVEFEAALTAFESLGAALDLQRAARLHASA